MPPTPKEIVQPEVIGVKPCGPSKTSCAVDKTGRHTKCETTISVKPEIQVKGKNVTTTMDLKDGEEDKSGEEQKSEQVEDEEMSEPEEDEKSESEPEEDEKSESEEEMSESEDEN
ncbi:hypothetical protein Pmani_014925 [Petrolisthes manimaculis]|uniref:Uncharacterized protein n=1 Tax=Petrolisthes manimaculis TaxID=1843537 RepID=A0AAE1U7V3_9EUCA|nr:hypothetical protein Pmani_014925 [Petrolisthes manimaculis]